MYFVQILLGLIWANGCELNGICVDNKPSTLQIILYVWMADFPMGHMCYVIWNVLDIIMPVECKEVDTSFLEKQDAKAS